MRVIAAIQARMGSTRLPGKVMLPLDCTHSLRHTIDRCNTASSIDDVIVATPTGIANDIINNYSDRFSAKVFRGSESDVLGRMYSAAEVSDADVIVRITGDCPLIDPKTIDAVVRPVINGNVEYAANVIERTFPRGLDVEAFTIESFEQVEREATKPAHREHVTPYYREHPEKLDLVNITSDQVFDQPWMQNRTDLRLTLDEANDYELLRNIYKNVHYDGILDIRDAVRYIDENSLSRLNANVEQKST